eukprot:Skav204333  [mRNA]  locus=scaffold55:86545:87187:+ [translate_table: standard]
MPLSVSQRRAAVRQFVAEQHGRPNDKRLDGPQVPKKAPEAILLLPYNDEAAAKRSAALLRVRQRRAERALGAEEREPLEALPAPGAAGGAALSCPEPKVPKGATLEAENFVTRIFFGFRIFWFLLSFFCSLGSALEFLWSLCF